MLRRSIFIAGIPAGGVGDRSGEPCEATLEDSSVSAGGEFDFVEDLDGVASREGRRRIVTGGTREYGYGSSTLV